MSRYDNVTFTTNLNAFKHSGVETTSLTVSGTLAGSGSATFTSGTITVTNPDHTQTTFDNSRKHSGRYRTLVTDKNTLILETTNNSELTGRVYAEIDGSSVSFALKLLNPNSGNVALQSTTINFRVVPYESTS